MNDDELFEYALFILREQEEEGVDNTFVSLLFQYLLFDLDVTRRERDHFRTQLKDSET